MQCLGNCNHFVPQDYSFDDIHNMPFTTLLSVQIAEWKWHIIYVISLCQNLCKTGTEPRSPGLQFWWHRWYASHSATCADSRVVKGISSMSSLRVLSVWTKIGHLCQILSKIFRLDLCRGSLHQDWLQMRLYQDHPLSFSVPVCIGLIKRLEPICGQQFA